MIYLQTHPIPGSIYMLLRVTDIDVHYIPVIVIVVALQISLFLHDEQWQLD